MPHFRQSCRQMTSKNLFGGFGVEARVILPQCPGAGRGRVAHAFRNPEGAPSFASAVFASQGWERRSARTRFKGLLEFGPGLQRDRTFLAEREPAIAAAGAYHPWRVRPEIREQQAGPPFCCAKGVGHPQEFRFSIPYVRCQRQGGPPAGTFIVSVSLISNAD